MSRQLEPLEIGVVFWTGGELGEPKTPAAIVETVKTLGLRCGQLAFDGAADLGPGAAAEWKTVLEDGGITAVTAIAAFSGESYADVATVEETVGYLPEATREERVERTLAISDLAAELGIPGLATHIGALPEDCLDSTYVAVRDVVRRICDHCAGHSQTFALETGQESAAALRQFILDVDRDNLRVNFDPANMVLYGSGEPMEALETVAPWVASVHCKDGVGPAEAGQLGTETPLGEGAVGMARYVEKLREIGYTGPLVIEREIVGEEQRADIRNAIELLEGLRRG